MLRRREEAAVAMQVFEGMKASRDNARDHELSLIIAYDGKYDPHHHIGRHVTSLLGETIDQRVKCLLFSITLTGGTYEWSNLLLTGSIKNFEQLKEMFVQRFVRRVPREREAIFTIQRRLKNVDFKREFIITPAVGLFDLSAQAKRFMTLEELIGGDKKVKERVGEKRKEPPKNERCPNERCRDLKQGIGKLCVESTGKDDMVFSFTQRDAEHVKYLHDDALVILARIGSYRDQVATRNYYVNSLKGKPEAKQTLDVDSDPHEGASRPTPAEELEEVEVNA
ncbi:hypothetical protein CRG98_001867 [Punica granatum]|uniref:Retrotransposon gag domain-containing protein n=1 Tax=Punica granatum TaxID=22663 RepID=A0A2I0LAM8_PUNGR|nr:hypothetical protein CRG98_001867 [Punica granatum]